MPLRIGFDMDGVLADFESAFREVEIRLFGEDDPPRVDEPEARAETEAKGASAVESAEEAESAEKAEGAPFDSAQGKEAQREPGAEVARVPVRRKMDKVWGAIEATPNFWATLKPIDPKAVRRIHAMMLRHGWEVFFITQRPRTAGEPVQRQTQRWLVEQGFDWPSVLVMPGSRGKAAGALHLDYLVDDSPKNCVDVISDSKARALLILREPDERTEASARRLGIGVAGSIGACLDILDQATEVHGQPSLLGKLARMVGWRA
jgi:hypothetical protein